MNIKQWIRFKVVCAWCGRRMRGFPLARRVSHTICPACREAITEVGGRVYWFKKHGKENDPS